MLQKTPLPPLTQPSRIRHQFSPGPMAVSEYLKCDPGLPETQINWLLKFGSVFINKKRTYEDRALSKGDYVRIHLEPRRFPLAIQDWSKRIVADLPDYWIINKPAGVPVHANLDNGIENISHQMSKQLGPCFVTQRLDIPTQGLLVLAKNPTAQSHFNKMLMKRKVQKIYEALTPHQLPTGHQLHYMENSPRSPRRIHSAGGEPEGCLPCELIILSSGILSNHQDRETYPPTKWASLSNQLPLYSHKIELLTGRTHQIRAQLAFLGSPIFNDLTYGGPKVFNADWIGLRACELTFPTPHGETLHFLLDNFEMPNDNRPERVEPP